MPEPTNPKKRSLMGASKLRKALRAAGHRLNPIVQIGKEGVTPGVLAQLSEALDHHELVKVKVGTESPEDRFEAAERISAEGNAQVAQVIGRVILAYRQHATAPKFEPLSGPRLALPDDDEAPAPRKRAAKRPQPETRKAPSRSREEFWARKVAADGRSRSEGGWSRKPAAAGSRPEGGRRIWTEKPPRKEVPKGPAGQAKELVGRRSKAAAGRPPPRGGPRGRPTAGKRPPRGR